MIDEADALEAGSAIGDSSHLRDGTVFVRLLAKGCWALTVDGRVFYLRRQMRRGHLPPQGQSANCTDPWSPDKGIA